MIRSTYIAPSEFAPSLSAIKRALMTYDQVLLPDPADRELMPSQAFFAATGDIPPIFGLARAEVRLLGKNSRYDDDFQQLLDHLAPAITQGSVKTISTYDLSSSRNVTIGGTDMGGFPLDPGSLLTLYECGALEAELLETFVADDPLLRALEVEQLIEIAVETGSADLRSPNQPPLPTLTSKLADEQRRSPLTSIARARLATVIKTIGYCEAKELVPFFSKATYGAAINEMSQRSAECIDVLAAHDPFWLRRNRVLDLAYAEYLDDQQLEMMSTADCLSFRTTAWGRHAERRDGLLRATAEISAEVEQDSKFEAKTSEMISDFRHATSSVIDERKKLAFNSVMDFGELGSKAALAGIAAHTAGTIAQLQTGIGVVTFMFTALALVIPKIKEATGDILSLRDLQKENEKNACLGVHNFFC